MTPNPNGANQYTLDPRQKLCWDLYVNPKSETFGNATQSAVKAGYEYDYADQITTSEWFKGRLRRLNMLGKAEKALDETLEYNPINEEGKIDPAIARVRLDAAKHITNTLGKDEGYSSRTEVTGKNGEPISTATDEITNLAKTLNELATGNNRTSFPSDGVTTVSLDKEVSD